MPPIDVRRTVRQLGTVVSADVATLRAIGIDSDDFLPLSAGIQRTVEWYRVNEGVTWHNPHTK